MTKPPASARTFLVAYWALMFVAYGPGFWLTSDHPPALLAAWRTSLNVLSFAAFAWAIHWIWSGIRFRAATSAQPKQAVATRLRLIRLLVLVAICGSLARLVLRQTVTLEEGSLIDILLTVASGLFVLMFFVGVWMAAAFVAKENCLADPSGRCSRSGTFLLMICAPITAVALYRRMMRGAPSSTETVEAALKAP